MIAQFIAHKTLVIITLLIALKNPFSTLVSAHQTPHYDTCDCIQNPTTPPLVIAHQDPTFGHLVSKIITIFTFKNPRFTLAKCRGTSCARDREQQCVIIEETCVQSYGSHNDRTPQP